jgi:radical SAM superfamily enzyme YgiQ (UPF0313 family)
MPHVAFVTFTGLRVREDSLRELGMTLPGLHRRATALSQLPALGLLTLAGLTPDEWTFSYHEAEDDPADLIERVAAERPHLVAVSALTASINDAYRFCAMLRRREIRVVLGGLHVTACPQEAARFGDSVVIGEGEPIWPQLLADATAGILQPVYHATAPFDLARSPIPRFDLLGARQPPRFTLQTERGCPFACDFCGASRMLGRFREKPLSNVQAELNAIASHSTSPWLELADDNTFAGNRDSEALLELLGASGARYFTESDWRIGERPDVLRKLSSSGCVQVLIGIESLVFRYPGMGAKQAELDRVMTAVQAIQDAGVAVNGCFILGADGETLQSLERLTEFILDSPFAEVQLTLQTPFPGTALYERLQREGRLLPNRDWSHYTLFDVTYQPDRMSVADLEHGFEDTVRVVFAPTVTQRRSNIRKRIARSMRATSP